MNTITPTDWAIVLDRIKARPEGKRGTYVAHFDQNGRHCKKSLKTRRLDLARKLSVQLEGQLTAGTIGAASAKRSLAEAVTEFVTAKIADGISRKTEAKYSRELLEFQKFACDQRVERVLDITEELFLAYRAHRRGLHLVSSGRTLHEKTLHVGLVIIKGFLRWCARKKFMTHNPVADVPISKPAFRPAYCPDGAAVEKVLAAAQGQTAVILKTLAFSGMRSGELQLLRRRDVDVTGNWLLVQTLKSKLTRTRPVRKVPIHPKLREALEAHLAASDGGGDVPLFTAGPTTKHPDGKHHVNTKHLNDQAQRLARTLGLTTGRHHDGFVIHSLRHFFETVAVNSNVPQRVVDTWLGHSSDRSMGAVYYRLLDADSQEMMGRVKF